MKYLNALIAILSMVIVSCNNNDEPTPVSTQYRMSFIHSDELTQTFDYNSEGNIKEWHCLESPSSKTIADASYDYDINGSSIMINAKELREDQKWIFEEILSLNIDGTAKSAEGVVGMYRVVDNSLFMKKRYSVAFKYNAAKQLESIRIVEKRIIDNFDDPNPLKWNIDFVWNNNNMTECREYVNPTSPLNVYEYSYYDGVGADYAPITQYPILRAYYTPLRYQGRFGVQTKGLIKNATIDNNYTTYYSYNLSTNSINSIVEGYVEKLPSGRETQYTIGWE